MRTVTFSRPEVNRVINERFVCTWFNQASDLFPGKPGNGVDRQPPVSGHYLQNFPDGAGGPNVKIFFCTPEGQIVHFIQGYYSPDTFLEEARFALRLLSSPPGDLQKLHEKRLVAISEEGRRLQVKPVPGDPAKQLGHKRRVALLGVMAGNHKTAMGRLLQDPKPFMVNEVLGFV